jgi:hypothetical protein
LLKLHNNFKWTEEANQVLQDLKHHFQLPPILTAPQPGENLLLYITATTHVVSTAIISEVLSESKVRYPTIQKILYGILITSRKLHHYFYAYNILVVSDFTLAVILHNRDATGRISKWAVELGALTLDFKPRTVIKLHALVDFMVEAPTNQLEHWVMYFDGSLKLGGSGAGVLFTA